MERVRVVTDVADLTLILGGCQNVQWASGIEIAGMTYETSEKDNFEEDTLEDRVRWNYNMEASKSHWGSYVPPLGGASFTHASRRLHRNDDCWSLLIFLALSCILL